MRRFLLLAAAAATLIFAPAAHALQPAQTLGPTPVVADCLSWHDTTRGCYYTVGGISFSLSQHILHVGDTVTGTATWNGSFSANWEGAPTGLAVQSCTPVSWSSTDRTGTCTYKAIAPTGGWRPNAAESDGANADSGAYGGFALHCCTIGTYTATDYVAVLSDQEAISGYTRDKDGKPATGATVYITGTDNQGNAVNVYATSDSNGEYNALVAKGTYDVAAIWQSDSLCITSEHAYCKQSITVQPTATVDFREKTQGRVVGKVLDKQGNPAGGVVLAARDTLGQIAGQAVSRSDGTYAIGNLDAGSYTVGALNTVTTPLDPVTRSVQIEGDEDETANFTLKLFQVSGKLQGRHCTDTGCQLSGVAGTSVAVSGTATDGSAVSEASTSSNDGSWAVDVPSGSYHVIPAGDGWDPSSRDESVSAATAGVDFVKCVNPDGSADARPGLIGTADATSTCDRPTKTAIYCQYEPRKWVGFGAITDQQCFVNVFDQGPPPHEVPTGTVSFRSLSIALNIFGVVDPNPCTLTPTPAVGASQCIVTLSPGTYAKPKDTLGVVATYKPSSKHWLTSEGSFSATYTPFLDPSNKSTAADIESHLILIGTVSGTTVGNLPVVGTVGKVAAGTAGLLAVPFHYLQLPSEPPDRHYRQVFRPRFVPVGRVTASSRKLRKALTKLRRDELSVGSWAGAEWNALNRSIIAHNHNDRAAFVTQMQAASKAELTLASLVAAPPKDLAAVRKLLPAKARRARLHVSAKQLAALRRSLRHPGAATLRVFKQVGIPASVARKIVLGPAARRLTRKALSGSALGKLTAIVNNEARSSAYLTRVAAIHASMAQLYG